MASPTRIASAADRRGRQALGAAQPSVGPACGEGPGRAVDSKAPPELVERGQQHLLDRALHRAQRERRLHRAVGAIELEAGQCADERVGVGAQRLAGAADRRGDRKPLLERVAQRGDLPVRVEAVAAGGALRLRIPEAALPGAQCVRADVEQRRGLARLESSHADIIRAGPARCKRSSWEIAHLSHQNVVLRIAWASIRTRRSPATARRRWRWCLDARALAHRAAARKLKRAVTRLCAPCARRTDAVCQPTADDPAIASSIGTSGVQT